MFDEETISADAQAIILSCSSIVLPRGDETKPFGPRGWAKLSSWLDERGAGPGSMLGLSVEDLGGVLGDVDQNQRGRLARLLARTGQLAFELDRLRSRGIWVVTVADGGYPSRLRERLGADAPPVLFGAGEQALLDDGGVAIVGSRDVDELGLAFTRAVASAVAKGGSPVVSGGARGVDQEAMRSAFEAGGSVVGALPEGIERRIREPSTRSALAESRAVLVSPYHPSAAFSAGAAMARNKIVYALSDAAVVVSSSAGTGGTWAGAVEALDAEWVPVLVHSGEEVPEGNDQLIARGGRALRLDDIPAIATSGSLVAVADPARRRVAEVAAPYEQQELSLTE
jgi:predicted Rossmann fold nucleotide-binding protein DprA/Smf involved in DNA uptake